MMKYLVLCLSVGMGICTTHSQSLFSPRALGIGAYEPMAHDIRGFDLNPAGLTSIRDWDFAAGTYLSTNGNSNGPVFQGLAIGKRFLDRHVLAIQYTPGSLLEFVVPTSVVLLDSASVSTNQRISYDEVFAVGYGLRLFDNFSVGLGGRLRTERISDSQYELIDEDSVSYIASEDRQEEARIWNIDLATRWTPWDNVTVSLVGRNIASFGNELSEEFKDLSLPHKSYVSVGGSYLWKDVVRVAAEFSSLESGAFGVEVLPGMNISLRAGVYLDNNDSRPISAVATGIGWSYEFLDIDVGYLRFTDQATRSGPVDFASFDPADIDRIDLNQFTRDKLSLSIKAAFGSINEGLLRIESVEILEGIYPAASEVFAYRPVGKVRVKNISLKPVYSKVSFMVERYMDSPTETEPVYLDPGEEREIAFTAVFNEQIKDIASMVVREGMVYVNATQTEQHDDKAQAKLLIHGKNDWNGDILSLRYFVTPNDPEVVRYARDILLEKRDSLDGVAADLQQFRKAQIVCNAFAGKLLHISDPRQSADIVQYPSETLRARTGDCDDMTICFSSLLNSIGISTAFVEVVPQENGRDGHIYLLFDTGLDPRYGSSISDNPKRYVVRKNQSGIETIWIPIETTVITRGFDEAWSSGAQNYFDAVEVGLGLIKGQVRIVDVY